MTTDSEMVAVGGPNLGSDIQAMASRWYHLPTEDFGIPDTEINSVWPEISENIRQALAGGGRVIVHCRGGCGRSGMVALRLMIECGEEHFTALNRLRALRDCAVETKAQLQWAFAANAKSDESDAFSKPVDKGAPYTTE